MKGDLHEIMRKIRVLKNYSQEYVAEKIGVSVSSYARYESKKVEIDFFSVLKLVDLYKMTLDEFIHFEDPDFKAEEPKFSYQKKWSVQVIISLDGTVETLNTAFKKLTAMNATI
jgi:transcriptional regulator with XRE-family HTH domain